MDDYKIFNNPCKIFNKTGGGKLVTFNSSPRFNLILEQPENIIVLANRILCIFFLFLFMMFCWALGFTVWLMIAFPCKFPLLPLWLLRCLLFRQKERKLQRLLRKNAYKWGTAINGFLATLRPNTSKWQCLLGASTLRNGELACLSQCGVTLLFSETTWHIKNKAFGVWQSQALPGASDSNLSVHQHHL